MLHTYLKEKTAFRKNHIKMDGRPNWAQSNGWGEGEEIFYNKLWIYFLHGHPHLLCLYTLILSPLVWWENILIRQNINFSNLMIYEHVTKNVYLYYILEVFFPFIINCFFLYLYAVSVHLLCTNIVCVMAKARLHHQVRKLILMKQLVHTK
jgi:hypothetical protein